MNKNIHLWTSRVSLEIRRSRTKASIAKKHCSFNGFTLIELSIVLVIIGLIVGGVLAGQDLIKSSQIRATITQIVKYRTAINTFRGKYDALPGDIAATDATKFGFLPASRFGVAGGGNNDGMITGDHPDWLAPWTQYYEPLWFWVDLSKNTHLIDDSFGNVTITEGTAASAAQLSQYYPQAKLGNGVFIWEYNFGGPGGAPGSNYFGMAALTGMDEYGNISASESSLGVTPQQAYGIDVKIDDGLPITGQVQALWIPGAEGQYQQWAPFADPGTSSTCFDDVTNQYSVGTNPGNPTCALSFPIQ